MLFTIIGKIIEYPVKLVLFVIGFLWFFNPLRLVTELQEGDQYDFLGREVECHEGSPRVEAAKGAWLGSVFLYGIIGSIFMWYVYGWHTYTFWDAVVHGGGFMVAWITLGFSVACSNLKWTEDIDIWKNAERRRERERHDRVWQPMRDIMQGKEPNWDSDNPKS